jgi:hypothetical protein
LAVYSRDPERRAPFAARVAASYGVDAVASGVLERAVEKGLATTIPVASAWSGRDGG